MSLKVLRTANTTDTSPGICRRKSFEKSNEEMGIILKQLKRRLRERILRDVPNKQEFQTLLENLNQINIACPKLQSQLLIWSVQLLNGGKSSQTSLIIPKFTTCSENGQNNHNIYSPQSTVESSKSTSNNCSTFVPYPSSTSKDTPIVEIPVVSAANPFVSSQPISVDEPSLFKRCKHTEGLKLNIQNKRQPTVEVVVSNKSPRKRQKGSVISIHDKPVHRPSPSCGRASSPRIPDSKNINKPAEKVVKIMEQSRSQAGKILYRVSWEDGSQSWESPKDLTEALELVEKYEHAQFRRYDSPGHLVTNRRRVMSNQRSSEQYLTDQSVEEFPSELTVSSTIDSKGDFHRFGNGEGECKSGNTFLWVEI